LLSRAPRSLADRPESARGIYRCKFAATIPITSECGGKFLAGEYAVEYENQVCEGERFAREK
jgi:hypothetical protein